MKASLKSFARLTIAGFIFAELLLFSTGPAFAVTPGTQYPSQKIVFTDPLTGKTVWRMTTDGSRLGTKHGAAGDQSSESRSFSPDSTKIVYSKYDTNSGSKPVGVYLMDIFSGIETFLAPSVWYAQPIFARDGSEEVYYYDRSGGELVVRAVSTQTYAVRTIVMLNGATWQEKIEVNADGSLISSHPVIGGTSRTVVFTPQGQFHANWGLSGGGRGDGAVWHPSDPKRVVAERSPGGEKIWHVDTLATTPPALSNYHSSLHPNGVWHLTQGYLTNIETGASVTSGGGMYPYHPNINPAQASLGLDAQVAVDDRRWDSIPGRPRLYLPTIRRLLSISNAIWASNDSSLAAVHYSSMANNYAHVHAHWSWDGQYVLWTSDVADLRDGSPPGGTGGGTDLFIFPLGAGSSSSSSTPTLTVSLTSLSFTAVEGGAAPAAQTFSISNTGGGTLTWTVSDNGAWLNTSVAAGAGNATVSVTTSPAGLAAGTYTGTITVTASGATGSPKTVAVTLTVAAASSSTASASTTTASSPVLSVAPTSLTFTAVEGGAAPAAQSFSISNTGGGTLSWAVSDNAAWLSASAASGTGNATVNVTASPTGLAAGTYTGTITVTASGASGSPRSVGVALTITAPPPVLSVAPTSLSFTMVQGGAAPPTQSFTISNTGGGTLTWTVNDSASWLGTSVSSGTGAGTVNAAVYPAGLTAGTYTGTITVTASGATGSPKTVAVTLTVTEAVTAAAAVASSSTQSASTTVTFDNPVPPGSSSGGRLRGVFQGIDFGKWGWLWEGPFNADPTNHIYFSSSRGTSRTFSFEKRASKILVGMRVFSTSSGTLTLSDDRGQTKVQTITAGSMQSVTTGWTQASTTITVHFTNGWDLGIDDIEYRAP